MYSGLLSSPLHNPSTLEYIPFWYVRVGNIFVFIGLRNSSSTMAVKSYTIQKSGTDLCLKPVSQESDMIRISNLALMAL